MGAEGIVNNDLRFSPVDLAEDFYFILLVHKPFTQRMLRLVPDDENRIPRVFNVIGPTLNAGTMSFPPRPIVRERSATSAFPISSGGSCTLPPYVLSLMRASTSPMKTGSRRIGMSRRPRSPVKPSFFVVPFSLMVSLTEADPRMWPASKNSAVRFGVTWNGVPYGTPRNNFIAAPASLAV